MKLILSLKEKLVIVIPLISFILIFSTIVFVAQYGSTPLSQMATQDILFVGKTSVLGAGEYSFEVMNGNVSVGTINSPKNVEEGKPVYIVNSVDSVNIPYLYSAREWTDIYVDDKLVVGGETNLLSYFVGALWFLPLTILVISLKNGRKNRYEN